MVLALETLHVCWEERSEGNCGRCEKCYRTLLALEILGVRGRCQTFPPGELNLAGLKEVWKNKPLFVKMYSQLRAHAAHANHSDILAVIDACLGSQNPAKLNA
jgi:hypothetical protein